MWFFKKSIKDTKIFDIEESLIEADFGPKLAEIISQKIQKDPQISLETIIETMITPFIEIIPTNFYKKPTTIMLIGVNGSGKTTTIAKLANLFINKGLSVDIAACDTFRVAATEQLTVLADKLGAFTFKAKDSKQDPASVAYDAVSKTNKDILLIDTAGRLQNNTNLMNELNKIASVLKKIDKNAPDYTYITIDATTGQNALDQVIQFNKFCKISGIILNKIDGGAKGGAIVRIINELQIPIIAVGIGENMGDIENFDINRFLSKLA
ncbi:MAG: hypothetical protein LBI26_00150 [Holosporales bacterium]|jgi:fused signal recognition particle receptor|nr:hypothetical protein [Holosporales bacterium]